MSQFVPELSLINYRVILIAPTVKSALEMCEKLAFDLTTDLSTPEQKLNLVNYSPARIPVNSFVSWTSATLGVRGTCHARLHMISFALENGLVSENVFEMADAIVFYNPSSDTFAERFLRLPRSREYRKKPALLINPEQSDAEKSFLQKALNLWAERHFSMLLSLKDEERLLERILDWTILTQ